MGARDLFDLSGKVALVAGGSRGIGLAVAEGLASAGAKVVVANSTPDQGERAAAQIRAQGYDARAIPLDIRQRASIDALVAATLTGVRPDRHPGECDRGHPARPHRGGHRGRLGHHDGGESPRRVPALPGRRPRDDQARHGKIINISSNVSQVLQPHRGAYAVTKAGMSHLTRVLGLEWAPHGINVNAIAPAPTITDLNRKFFEDNPKDLEARKQSIPLGRLGTPADYVGAAVFLASKASDFVTGQTYFVDGGSNLI